VKSSRDLLFLASAVTVSLFLVPLLEAQSSPVDSLNPTPISWQTSDLDLRGPARPGSYIGVVGRRAVAMGSEQGDIEVWTWPLKLLHGFNLRFQTPLYDEPIEGRDVARRVEVTPAGTTITYSHPAFTVRQRIFAAVNDPAIIMVLEVDAVRPIQIIAEFQSDLQYAWPASLGGQYAFWDDKEKAFVLSESRRMVNGYVGSPYTTSATNQPAHNVPESPNQMRIAVGDQTTVPMPRLGEPAGRLTVVHASGIPIVMVGAAAPRDSVRAIYQRVLTSIPALYAERVAHARAVIDSAMGVSTPDSLLDLAVRWAELNMDEAMVCNPDLGCGLVAGYGPSGNRGTRPGFGWFFGGDASINSLGMSGAGQFALARDGLEFFTRYQNAEGKIPHEISQSAGRIRWFEDYPYAFYHADTTPYWLMAWGDYWCATGDTTSVRRVWPSIRKAYEWSRGTIDSTTGLMLNSKGGLGAVEVGDLGVGVESDIYLSAVWVVALDRVARMADALKERRMAAEARALLARAGTSLRERFWLADQKMYAFALLKDNAIRPELTVWPATAMSFGLFDDERGMAGATALARATLNTDWGTRALASESKLFDPLHYNNGTVWPFVTGFEALGQYKYRNPTAGFAALSTIVRSGFTWGLGRNPEVWSGSQFEPLDTAVPHQFFGTSFILTVLTRGLLGWEPDVPSGIVRLAPQLPTDWPSMSVHGARAGNGLYNFHIIKSANELRTIITRKGGPDTLVFAPHLPLGASVSSVQVNGTELHCEMHTTPRDVQPICRIRLDDRTEVVVKHTPGFQVSIQQPDVLRGDRSKSVRLLDMRLENDQLLLDLEGPAGSDRVIEVVADQRTQVSVHFDGTGDPLDGYVRQVVRVPIH
jgi:glycogen debranching enzyme